MLNDQDFFDVLSDETRRRILHMIMKEGELCVCELYYALDITQPKVSRHLAIMREMDLLSARRDGTWIYYRLHPQLPYWAVKILEVMMDGVANVPVYIHDATRMSGMPNRPDKCCS